MSQSSRNPFRVVGAIAPSSKQLAEQMASLMNDLGPEALILEVGAGTGAITKSLVNNMQPKQKLDVVELVPSFFKLLKKRFAHYEQLELYCQDIRSFNSDKKYDLIVSSLPFNAFSPELLKNIISHLFTLAKKGTLMSFFEYKGVEIFQPLILNKKEREEFFETRRIINDFIKQFQINEASVNFNIPPARVHFLLLDKNINVS